MALVVGFPRDVNGGGRLDKEPVGDVLPTLVGHALFNKVLTDREVVAVRHVRQLSDVVSVPPFNECRRAEEPLLEVLGVDACRALQLARTCNCGFKPLQQTV